MDVWPLFFLTDFKLTEQQRNWEDVNDNFSPVPILTIQTKLQNQETLHKNSLVLHMTLCNNFF